jgi:hypothetical protein
MDATQEFTRLSGTFYSKGEHPRMVEASWTTTARWVPV